LFYEHAFIVNGEADMEGMVKFLHRFYSAGYLHRVKSLTAKGQVEKDKRELNVAMVIEALSLEAAPNDPPDVPAADPPLAKDIPSYSQVILGRNFFFPPNNPPRMDPVSRKLGHPNEALTFDVTAKDDDKWDRVVFSLVPNSEMSGATMTDTGQFSWTPTETGTYTAVVRVKDSGHPPLTDDKTVTIEVSKPRPREIVKTKPKWGREDPARDAKVTGIGGPTDNLQAWITAPRGLGDQPKTLHLKAGDPISIGSFTGVVKQVREREAEFELEGGRTITPRLGQSLVEDSQM
jgi:hypothetical protein